MASTAFDLSTVRWRKSSYSNGSGGDCVEAAEGLPAMVPVRDSKTAEEGPVLVFPLSAWTAFVAEIKR
ncbi:DUF397 domain-containing protein [Streptomyces sp. NBC_01017]|uniref:DUF397 domain-containing protein n=1 Tax=Streptomyces sp. NBC_01017 TaxID=2903721 RepID=UPI0038690D6E|nr:DUF397 domain-containing protein [Streptomyces sp. NBC_01017]